MKDNPYFMGVIVGRVANRIWNAIFDLNSTRYTLERNDGTNCLHGGSHGFANVTWDAEVVNNGVCFTYVSEDNDQGFPGKVIVSAMYTLVNKSSESCVLRLCMNAKLDPNEILSSPINLAGNYTHFSISIMFYNHHINLYVIYLDIIRSFIF